MSCSGGDLARDLDLDTQLIEDPVIRWERKALHYLRCFGFRDFDDAERWVVKHGQGKVVPRGGASSGGAAEGAKGTSQELEEAKRQLTTAQNEIFGLKRHLAEAQAAAGVGSMVDSCTCQSACGGQTMDSVVEERDLLRAETTANASLISDLRSQLDDALLSAEHWHQEFLAASSAPPGPDVIPCSPSHIQLQVSNAHLRERYDALVANTLKENAAMEVERDSWRKFKRKTAHLLNKDKHRHTPTVPVTSGLSIISSSGPSTTAIRRLSEAPAKPDLSASNGSEHVPPALLTMDRAASPAKGPSPLSTPIKRRHDGVQQEDHPRPPHPLPAQLSQQSAASSSKSSNRSAPASPAKRRAVPQAIILRGGGASTEVAVSPPKRPLPDMDRVGSPSHPAEGVSPRAGLGEGPASRRARSIREASATKIKTAAGSDTTLAAKPVHPVVQTMVAEGSRQKSTPTLGSAASQRRWIKESDRKRRPDTTWLDDDDERDSQDSAWEDRKPTRSRTENDGEVSRRLWPRIDSQGDAPNRHDSADHRSSLGKGKQAKGPGKRAGNKRKDCDADLGAQSSPAHSTKRIRLAASMQAENLSSPAKAVLRPEDFADQASEDEFEGQSYIRAVQRRRKEQVQADPLRFKGRGAYAANMPKEGEGTITSRFVVDPKANYGEKFVFDQVARGKDQRKSMHGTGCACCNGYYEKAGESAADARGDISRHRHFHEPNGTPPGFWDMAFPNTQRVKKINRDAEEKKQRKMAAAEAQARDGHGIYRYRDPARRV